MANHNDTQNMTTGDPARLILRFTYPLMLGNVLSQLYTIVDTAIVGQGVGITALAAVGASDWLNWFVMWMMHGLCQGFAILVSHRFGAEDEKGLRKTIAMSTLLCLMIGGFFTVGGMLWSRPGLLLLNTPDTVLDDAVTYLRIIYGGILVTTAYAMASGILRSMGDSKSPTMAIVIASLLNIALDLLFVMVFHWGVAGAAIATVLSQLFSFLYCFMKLRQLPQLHLTRADFKWDGFLCRRLLGQGLPNAFSMAVIAMGGMMVQLVINGNGENFVAGFTATNKLWGLLEGASNALGAAMATYMGQNIGAGRIDRLRLGIRRTAPYVIGIPVVLGVLMILVGRFILRLFISGDEATAQAVEDIAYRYLVVMSVSLWVLYPLNVNRSALQGLGESALASVSGFVEIASRGLVAMVLVPCVHPDLIYFAEPAAWVTSSLYLGLCLFYKLNQLEKRFGRQETQA